MALIQMNVFSNEISKNTEVTIIFPDNVKKEGLKVLFLLHGAYGNNQDWTRYSIVERLANEYKVMVVMPDGALSYYTNMVFGQNYFNFIGHELFDIINITFNVNLTNKNTYIAGLSMGGYGAFKFAFTNPEKYRGVASFSGALDVKSIYNRYEEKTRTALKGVFGERDYFLNNINQHDLYHLSLAKDIGHLDIYLSCGTEDFLYENNVEFKKHLDKNNIKHKYSESKGDHNWDYWNQEIQEVFKHFFNS